VSISLFFNPSDARLGRAASFGGNRHIGTCPSRDGLIGSREAYSSDSKKLTVKVVGNEVGSSERRELEEEDETKILPN
jgi:hypothetical protein